MRQHQLKLRDHKKGTDKRWKNRSARKLAADFTYSVPLLRPRKSIPTKRRNQ